METAKPLNNIQDDTSSFTVANKSNQVSKNMTNASADSHPDMLNEYIRQSDLGVDQTKELPCLRKQGDRR